MKITFNLIMIITLFFMLVSCVSLNTNTKVVKEKPGRITHNNQDLFLSGINLAWISFGRDLTNFSENDFIAALDEISTAGANSIRWWIHVNGSSTPIWDGNYPVGMPENSLDNFEKALDLAWERGILIIPTLWSFDMLQEQAQMDPVRNKNFLEDYDAVTSYLDNVLTPIIKRVGNHPSIIAWEVFNEPEGMIENIGWANKRVSMNIVQSFVNRVSGRIHLINPNIKVTNGTKDMSTLTDIGEYTNYYSDQRLIAEGGDPLGVLDFYQVHYYPTHMGESLSPFHHPKSYWGLNKELIIGEFPAIGIVDYGHGFKPSTTLTPEEAYVWAENMGYAGALAWTWTAHEPELGSLNNIESGLMNLKFTKKSSIVLNNGDVDWIPVKINDIERILIPFNSKPLIGYVDLKNIFNDKEDGKDLIFSIVKNSNLKTVDVSLNGSLVDIIFPPGESGKATIIFSATDKSGNSTTANLQVVVVDPDKGNIALFKPVESKTTEVETNGANMINDGLLTTRYSSEYLNDQWLIINLEGLFEINSATISWEAAFGKEYSMDYSLDGENWQPLFNEVNGSEGFHEYSFKKTKASFIKLNLDKRGTEWGFSIWELELIGQRVK